MKRFLAVLLASTLALPTALHSQNKYFIGGVGGVSTLSADGKSSLSATPAAMSSYKPENGGTFWFMGGRHWNDWFSIQASYGWNRNSLKLTSIAYQGEAFAYYEQSRSASQHTLAGEALVYFRGRESRLRPYLSTGAGVVHLSSPADTIKGSDGGLVRPSAFSSTAPAIRVAVGIDVFLKDNWAFRFTFSETIRNNPISRQLSPPGVRNLAHFQNLFGLVKHF